MRGVALEMDSLLSAVRGAPHDPAIISAQGDVITYEAMRVQLAAIGAAAARAVPRGTRIAAMLPDTAEAALTMLAIAQHGQLMALNPALSDLELEDILRSSGARILLAPADDQRAQSLARSCGLEHGTVTGTQVNVPHMDGTPCDPGLILLTSGSTGTPKRVPLRCDQLLASARRIARALELGPQDCAVHALPVFHIGALVDLLLAPLVCGGCVRFAGGMDPIALERATNEGANWLQVVPTMLNRLRAQLSDARMAKMGTQLRLIRSVSADLAPEVQAEIEALFGGTPILQMYGMTETAGQITTNPLPPHPRKPGSVGKPFEMGLRIAKSGEIEVHGDSLTSGYETAERHTHFTEDGWLRTGDLGRLDADGYVFLTGRSKDMINRGGEKISPFEVERAALLHPGVYDAAAFAVSHPSLGEEVGLAVTARKGAQDVEIRAALAEHIAPFKCPRRVLILPVLPRLGSGKIDRQALRSMMPSAQQDGPESTIQDAVTRQVVKAWQSVLPETPAAGPGAQTDFFDAGGDSLAGAQFVFEVERRTGRDLPPNLLFNAPVFVDFTEAVRAAPLKDALTQSDPKHAFLMDRLAEWDAEPVPQAPLFRQVGRSTAAAPLFWCVQDEGEYQQLAQALGDARRLYLCRSLFLMAGKNDAMSHDLAQSYAAQIMALQPEGALRLGGFCEGAKIMAYAVKSLRAAGRDVHVMISWDQWFDASTSGAVDAPVLHIWSDDRHARYSARTARPELAIGQAHPLGHSVRRAPGGHTELLTKGPLDVLLPDLRTALDGGLPAPIDVPKPYFDEPATGAVHIHAPRLSGPGRKIPVRLAVQNTGANAWHAAVDAPLYLRLQWINLDGHVREATAALAQIESPIAPGAPQVIQLEVTVPQIRSPLRLEVTLFDAASQQARTPHGPLRAARLIWPVLPR